MSSVNETLTPRPSAILCADWGKESAKRAVYLADIAARVVRRVPGKAWSLAGLLEEAQRWTSMGSVLVTVDSPLGVPKSYLAALNRVLPGLPLTTFLDLLGSVASMPRFFDCSSFPGDWTVDRPFFAVPAGVRGLSAYEAAAASYGVRLRRSIDRQTAAKSVFIKSGIPGSVGSAACALWQELAPLLAGDRTFRVWPFEGDLRVLLRTSSVVLGEIYPRAAYATALLPAPPSSRSRLSVAKRDASVRSQAIISLRKTDWVDSLAVRFENLVEAEANEDDFDACLTAAALLRCVLGGTLVEHAHDDAARAEGGMLGTAGINLQLTEQKFGDPRRGRSNASQMACRARLCQAAAPLPTCRQPPVR